LSVWFSPDAERVLDELEKEERYDLIDSIWDIVDVLEQHPGSAVARRRSLRTLRGHTVWLVPIPICYEDDRWVILWQSRGDDVLIPYIGPEDFLPRNT
jgi:hypothetical protein